MDELGSAAAGSIAPVRALDTAIAGAGSSASSANSALEGFISTADQLAEKMFPGEYALREAQELMALLDQYRDKLDSFQIAGVEGRIADQFRAAELGIRELEEATKDSAGNMADEIQKTLGSVLGSLFDGPLDSAEEFFDKVMTGMAEVKEDQVNAMFAPLKEPN